MVYRANMDAVRIWGLSIYRYCPGQFRSRREKNSGFRLSDLWGNERDNSRVITGTFGHLNGSHLIAVSGLI